MKIKFFKDHSKDKKARATIHNRGKLGFTKVAAEMLELGTDAYIMIGQNEENKADKNLYVVVTDEKYEGCYTIQKASDYFYVKTSLLFDSLKVDYKNNLVTFDITEGKGLSWNKYPIYVFAMNIKPRKSNK
jgi:hypothetical protein